MKESELVNKLMAKMFSIIGLKFTEDFVTQEKWYKKYTWDKKQEDKFRDYFIKEHIKHFKRGQKVAQQDFEWWNLCYGWIRNDL